MDAVPFGELLRRFRLDAHLTQTALAVRSGLSVQAVGMLERGVRRSPRPGTVAVLSRALRLGPSQTQALVTASVHDATRAPADAAGAAPAATRTLPRDLAAFTGRERELARLLADVAQPDQPAGTLPIVVIDGMAGVGKTALAVHAAHRLAAEFPDGQVYLALHTHTPGQRPVTAAAALSSLLLVAGVAAQAIPRDLEARGALWRDRLAGTRTLVVLDDAAGHEQVRPLLPGAPGCLVLITSRRRLAALEDARSLTLDTMPAAEAAELVTRLIGDRADDGRTDAVADLVELCGHLPLAIALVAGRLRSHPAWTVGHLADRLRTAQDRLAEMRAENVAVEAAFDLSYQHLDADRQRLFRRVGLHPGPDLDVHAAAALDGVAPELATQGLDALHGDHLLDEPVPGRYRLHDLIRAYARTLAAHDDPADGEAAIDRLLDHYLLAAGTAASEQALDWLEAESANLGACVAAAAAEPARAARAVELARTTYAFLRGSGHWEQALAGHRAVLAAARAAGDRLGTAGILLDLGDLQRTTDNYREATVSLEEALAIYREAGDLPGQASALRQLGTAQRLTDRYETAAASLHEALAIFRDCGDAAGQADAFNELGMVGYQSGDFATGTVALGEALELYRELDHRLGQANVLANIGVLRLQMGDGAAAGAALAAALDLYRGLGHRLGQANSLKNLGFVHLRADACDAAIAALDEALELYRGLGHRLGRANALSCLGEAQARAGDHAAAVASLRESIVVYREVGARLGRASALNELGHVQTLTGDLAGAATSLDQALALFDGLGHRHGRAHVLVTVGLMHCAAGNHAAATEALTDALAFIREAGDLPGLAAAAGAMGVALGLAGDHDAARASLEEALAVASRLEHRLGRARALNQLGAVLLRSAGPAEALDRHRRALDLAREIGSPLEEARALEGIGRCRTSAGDAGGRADLEQALALYRRLGVAESQRVTADLRAPQL